MAPGGQAARAATVLCYGVVVFAAGPAAAPRMLQSQDGNATAELSAVFASTCAAVVSRGLCGQIGDRCPAECEADGAAGGALPPDPDQTVSCSAVASGGRCAAMGDLCPAACAGDHLPPPPPPPGQPIATSCATLIELDGGCAHDLSATDPAAAPGTRVSDVCPEDCSGHGGCAPTAADVSFLKVARDGSGHGVEVGLGGDACGDGSGMLLSGGGWAELAVGSDYVSDGACTLSFWLLKGVAIVWEPEEESAERREVVFSHPEAEEGGDSIYVVLVREAWYDHFSLEVQLGTAGVWSFAMDTHRDAVPLWTHLSVAVDGNSVRVYRDGVELLGEHIAATGSWCRVRGYCGVSENTYTTERLAELSRSDESGYCGSEHSEYHTTFFGWPNTVGSLGWQNRGDPNRWIETCTCLDALTFPAGCSIEVRAADGGQYTYDRSIHLNDDPVRSVPGYDSVRSIRIFSSPSVSEDAVFRGAGFASAATVGAWASAAGERHEYGLSGTLAMFQIYPTALEPDRARCIYEGGRRLVQSGRLALAANSACREAVDTGCTDRAAANGPRFGSGSAAIPVVDDGSCVHELPASAVTERGILRLTDGWQTVTLRGSYARPLAFCNLLSRSSTTQAFIRVGNLQADRSGSWSFDVKAEQKSSCHLADPPPLAEVASFLVVEAGLAAEGWQAGMIRVYEEEWHRASFHRPFETALLPVVLTQVQNFDERIKLITTRQHLSPGPFDDRDSNSSAPHFAVFMQVEGDGIFCSDGQYFTEYFDNLDLLGSPVATLCERNTPDWHWHSCCNGVPDAMGDAGSSLFFSARWQTRFEVTDELPGIIFSSYASGGSRVIFDGTVVLDAWQKQGSTFSGDDPVAAGPGYHTIAYEYRSAESTVAAPTNSYAQLSWHGVLNVTDGAAGEEAALFADVGWFAVSNGTGSISGGLFEAGYMTAVDSSLVVDITFAGSFEGDTPHIFAGYQATSSAEGGHCRLVEADLTKAAIALEYDSCDVVMTIGTRAVGWLALTSAADSSEDTRVQQQPAYPPDVVALLAMASALRLPGYLRWRPGSDPCRDRWAGLECRADGDQAPRVVMVDVRGL